MTEKAPSIRILPIIMALNALSLVDRQILTLMVDPIKQDLQLSDFQIGILQGLVFSVFYGLASLPIGWLVDRFPRRPIIWAGVTLWSLAASACGLAQTYTQLLIARLGVGVGEATLSPAAYSMLADIFPRTALTRALAFLLVGATIGNGLAIALGGAIVEFAQSAPMTLPVVGEIASWQAVFIITGLPGLVAGLLIFLVAEPRRREVYASRPATTGKREFVAAHARFLLCHTAGFGLMSVMGWGFISWLPTYMMREFHWSVGELSIPLALLLGGVGTIGTLGVGWLTDRLFGRGMLDAHMRIYCVAAMIATASAVAAFSMSSPWLFLILCAPIVATMTLSAPAIAALQLIAPGEIRAQVSAGFQFVANGVGLGLGPMLVGFLTDYAFGDEQQLGTAMALLYAVLGPLAALAFYFGGRPMREALQLRQATDPSILSTNLNA